MSRPQGTQPLTPTEVRVLQVLVASLDRAVPTETLLDRVWSEADGADPSYVWVTIRRLRRKLEVDPDNPRYLITERGIGYRLSPTQRMPPPAGGLLASGERAADPSLRLLAALLSLPFRPWPRTRRSPPLPASGFVDRGIGDGMQLLIGAAITVSGRPRGVRLPLVAGEASSMIELVERGGCSDDDGRGTDAPPNAASPPPWTSGTARSRRSRS